MKSKHAPAPVAGPVFYVACGSAEAALPEPSVQTMGNKGFNLYQMAALGLPVPPAVVLGTAWCAIEESARARLLEQPVATGIGRLNRTGDRHYGDARRPLLLSVRSGAPVSMPGMMDTLLNVGLCDATLHGFLCIGGNPRLVWDSYRRLVASFGEVVAGISPAVFEQEYQLLYAGRDEGDLDYAELRVLTRRYLEVYQEVHGRAFPQDPEEQLLQAINAVFRSWQSEPARHYRASNSIDDAIGTAVIMQAMVFGNAGGSSGAGVGFTRNPVSGERGLWVDFLFNCQGEDVVSGRRTAHGHQELAARLPELWVQLQTCTQLLERKLGDMQDFEFTVESGRLFMLQTRNGKRTRLAGARIALDLLEDGIIKPAMARERLKDYKVGDLVRDVVVNPEGEVMATLATGKSASGGVVTGVIALDAEATRRFVERGVPAVLLRRDAETADIEALDQALGLLTQRGARTSHAAVVARQLGKACVVGCENLRIDLDRRHVQLGETRLQEGDTISVDGNLGCIYAGQVQTRKEPVAELQAGLKKLRARHRMVSSEPAGGVGGSTDQSP